MTDAQITDEQIIAKEERDIFGLAVQAAFARFANIAALENLRQIHDGVGALVRKLDRLEAQEAANAAEAQADAEPGAEDNVVRMPA